MKRKIVVLLKFYRGELNPFDGAALETALRLGCDVTALAMAPSSAAEGMRSLTRLGVRAVLVSDRAYAGSDTIATSYILSEAIKRLEFDAIFCGRQSVDGDTGQVPAMLAQRLGLDFYNKVMQTDGTEFRLRGGESVRPQGRYLAAFEKICALRFPSIFSKAGETEVWDNSVLGLDPAKCGLQGSPTRVVSSRESTVGRRSCTFVSPSALPSLIEEGLKKGPVFTKSEKKSEPLLGKCVFIGKIERAAECLSTEAVSLDVLGKTPEEIAEEILSSDYKTVLWEGTDLYKELAARTAVLLGAGLCADCIDFSVRDGRAVMTRPACGGNVIADIMTESRVSMATVKTARRGADVMFAVGRGGLSVKDEIAALAGKHGGEIGCSRVAADSGAFPYEAQVGLTGKIVSPKVYVAIGISGAVQHTCGMENSGTVIAVNPNKDERIFSYADYGIVADAREIV